tara:strand:- start:8 stop:391 length:384 start_codon:yes stop_codon:yes gene_type:complete
MKDFRMMYAIVMYPSELNTEYPPIILKSQDEDLYENFKQTKISNIIFFQEKSKTLEYSYQNVFINISLLQTKLQLLNLPGIIQISDSMLKLPYEVKLDEWIIEKQILPMKKYLYFELPKKQYLWNPC